ncbi:hypothetical protein NIASO_16330 [Niabella soli DSM 19437]|uniref:Uncharacterized protein n=1 Tax=Niabella soli DSM 19437 TaxID=929713 RepID=W0F7X1_9BACT|nr:hypothetical protein NIASO_16330 [Niabella soli DSM 19437]
MQGVGAIQIFAIVLPIRSRLEYLSLKQQRLLVDTRSDGFKKAVVLSENFRNAPNQLLREYIIMF